MKPLILLVTLLILVSCGNGKIHLKRISPSSQTIVNIEEVSRERTNVYDTKSALTRDKTDIPKTEKSKSTVPADVEIDVNQNEKTHPTPEIDHSIEGKQPTDKEKEQQALSAEKDAKRARGLLIASLIGFFALVVPGVILFIFGTIYYFRARNAQYITEKGKKALDVARVFFLVDLVLVSAILVATAIIIVNSFI